VRGYAAKLKADARHAAMPAPISAFLDRQKGVDRRKGAGVTGYCMGGPLVLGISAAAVPNAGDSRRGDLPFGCALVTDAGRQPAPAAAQEQGGLPDCHRAQNDDEQRPA
jgi:carboxymethylenebutenolidase